MMALGCFWVIRVLVHILSANSRLSRQRESVCRNHTELCQAGSGDRLWEELEGRGFPLLAIDLLQKLICLDPAQRISAEEALQVTSNCCTDYI